MVTLTRYGFDKSFNRIKESGKDFQLIRTNYSAKLFFENEIYFYSTVFSGKGRTFFRLFQQLQKELKNNTLENFKNKINYFSFHRDNIFNVKECVCVDISAAYATALVNKSVISEELYTRILRLPKLHRLKILGMLATNKVIMERKSGEISIRSEINKYENVFFYACKIISDLMQQCIVAAAEDFYFFWVDGIFLHPRAAEKICKIIGGEGFRYRLEHITDFTISNSRLFIQYVKKEGNTETKKKYYFYRLSFFHRSI